MFKKILGKKLYFKNFLVKVRFQEIFSKHLIPKNFGKKITF